MIEMVMRLAVVGSKPRYMSGVAGFWIEKGLSFALVVVTILMVIWIARQAKQVRRSVEATEKHSSMLSLTAIHKTTDSIARPLWVVLRERIEPVPQTWKIFDENTWPLQAVARQLDRIAHASLKGVIDCEFVKSYYAPMFVQARENLRPFMAWWRGTLGYDDFKYLDEFADECRTYLEQKNLPSWTVKE